MIPAVLSTASPLRRAGVLRTAGLALAGSALLAASAQVAVPMWPVPMTLQTLAVLLIGATAGPRLGLLTVLAYLAEAAVGLPVLAHGAPLLAAGPTIGYPLGFLPAVALTGWLVGQGWSRGVRLVAALTLGHLAIYGCGLLWLDLVWLHDAQATLKAGLLPFLAGDAVKVAAAAALLHGVARRA